MVGQPLGGVIKNVNWFRADGIPILPVDDSGRDNAYPLVRVRPSRMATRWPPPMWCCRWLPRRTARGVISIPTRLCTSLGLTCEGQAVSFASQPFTVVELDNADDWRDSGDTDEQKVLNAAKINILRLHDAKHRDNAGRNLQCRLRELPLLAGAGPGAGRPAEPR